MADERQRRVIVTNGRAVARGCGGACETAIR